MLWTYQFVPCKWLYQFTLVGISFSNGMLRIGIVPDEIIVQLFAFSKLSPITHWDRVFPKNLVLHLESYVLWNIPRRLGWNAICRHFNHATCWIWNWILQSSGRASSGICRFFLLRCSGTRVEQWSFQRSYSVCRSDVPWPIEVQEWGWYDSWIQSGGPPVEECWCPVLFKYHDFVAKASLAEPLRDRFLDRRIVETKPQVEDARNGYGIYWRS